MPLIHDKVYKIWWLFHYFFLHIDQRQLKANENTSQKISNFGWNDSFNFRSTCLHLLLIQNGSFFYLPRNPCFIYFAWCFINKMIHVFAVFSALTFFSIPWLCNKKWHSKIFFKSRSKIRFCDSGCQVKISSITCAKV